MLKKLLFILLFFPFIGFGQTSNSDWMLAQESMLYRLDTQNITQDSFTIVKLEMPLHKKTEKKEKWLGTLILITRDMIKDHQIY
jgi:hypothetical protein